MSKKPGKKTQKVSAAQREEKAAEAKKKDDARRKQQARKETAKKVGIVMICLILVLALGIPTVALSLLGGGM